ncbi:natterin-3-like, partial [Oreochromis niloticus]|uniref:natterin-3-like n=1 Tax=Oreochromis niloticus TaxID=8128 RepID=UPI000DF361A3
LKLSLLLLLALSSASPQDIVKKHSEDRHGKMTWTGSVPDEAVSIWNLYDIRVDYVCKYGCHAGVYNWRFGNFCHYSFDKKEYRTNSFDILVNDKYFEILEWKEGSFGSVPANAVRTCSSDEVYVGKNKYGLGKVRPSDWAFYLPWGGEEYWYWYYEVLTIKRDIDHELIHDVEYKINDAKMIRNPPSTLAVSPISNNGCPATDWQRSQGAPHLSPYGSWGRLQPPCDPELDKWKKMYK